MVAESMLIFAPMSQLGCATACAGVTPRISSSEKDLNGPPLAVRVILRTWSILPPDRHWNIALCSLSTGNNAAPDRRTAAIINAPAETNASLLAKATVLPASIAAIVEGNPAQPTIEAIVQSTLRLAASTSASAPAAASIPVPANASFRSA